MDFEKWLINEKIIQLDQLVMLLLESNVLKVFWE